MAEIAEEKKSKGKAEKTAPKKFVCTVKCYAGGLVYNPGDTAEGADFSNNPCFSEVRD